MQPFRRQLLFMLDSSCVNALRNKRILITGAAGSIGSALFARLKNDSCTVAGLDIIPGVDFRADIRNELEMVRIFDEFRPQVVFHAAALKDVPEAEALPFEAISTNVFGTLNLGVAAQQFSVEKVVLLSTDKAVYPASIMGASKRVCELIFAAFGSHPTQFVTVRLGNVRDTQRSVLPKFRSQIEAGGPVTVTHRGMERFFITVDQAVTALIHAAAYGKAREILLPPMGTPVSILKMAQDLIGHRREITIQFTGMRPGEKLTEALWDREHEVPAGSRAGLTVYELKPRPVWDAVQKLRDALQAQNTGDLLRVLRRLLPEYKCAIAANA